MINRVLIRSLSTIAVLLCSCGASEEQTKPPDLIRQESTIDFRSSEDTVLTSRPAGEAVEETSSAERPIRFMVQIGAFANPVNASRVQDLARERFGIPVFNDYRTDLRLYQVRIGFFEDREAATTFRAELMQKFPGDYHDAWIVELLP